MEYSTREHFAFTHIHLCERFHGFQMSVTGCEPHGMFWGEALHQ